MAKHMDRIAFEIAPQDKARFQFFVRRYGNMSSILKQLVIEFNEREKRKQGPYPGDKKGDISYETF